MRLVGFADVERLSICEKRQIVLRELERLHWMSSCLTWDSKWWIETTKCIHCYRHVDDIIVCSFGLVSLAHLPYLNRLKKERKKNENDIIQMTKTCDMNWYFVGYPIRHSSASLKYATNTICHLIRKAKYCVVVLFFENLFVVILKRLIKYYYMSEKFIFTHAHLLIY